VPIAKKKILSCDAPLLVVKLHHLLDAPRFPPAFLEGSFPINAVCFLHTEFSAERYRLLFVNVNEVKANSQREHQRCKMQAGY
jgi:hypothetical protein